MLNFLYIELLIDFLVFKQGEEGSEWFVLLSGAVTIQVATPEVPEGEVICVVLAGQGFGRESKEGEVSKRFFDLSFFLSLAFFSFFQF